VGKGRGMENEKKRIKERKGKGRRGKEREGREGREVRTPVMSKSRWSCGRLQGSLPLLWEIQLNVTQCGLFIQGANYKKILRLSYDVIITYDNRKSNLR